MRQLEGDCFQHNAWDNVELTEEQKKEAELVIQSHKPMNQDESMKLLSNCRKPWDIFYKANKTFFFKDRNWLPHEFKELFLGDELVVFEGGCGVGNLFFPLFKEWKLKDKQIKIHACDFSPVAVDLIKRNSLYEPSMNIFVHDLTATEELSVNEKVDVAILVFVLSALEPKHLPQVIRKIKRILKPNGLCLFRDYARLDLAQLRMKPQRFIQDNLYRRGDNTLVNFMTLEEACSIFTNEGFEVLESRVDHRLITNRKRGLKMNRCWLQCKFKLND